ncbi:MAG: hypothetical protein H7829_11730 [Magnetococcus sp. THC-1_WYH]
MINNRNIYLFTRLACYALIWLAYVSFMAQHAPSGVDWAPYHSQRLFNAVEYLRLNGYLSSYGYSVWTSCTDCDLTSVDLRSRIYVSVSALKFAPHILLNEIGGRGLLNTLGPALDKLVIFLAGALTSEILILCVRSVTSLPKLWVGVVSFVLFTTAPWTYKMITASWMEIYFLLFFLLAMWLFLRSHNKSACFAYFLACTFHYMFGVIVGVVWVASVMLGRVLGESSKMQSFLPEFVRNSRGIMTLAVLSILPAMQELFTRWIASWSLSGTAGSSLLVRIGISGDDPHNGGILGALQFMGGNRITFCLKDPGRLVGDADINEKITAFNCVLATAGMTFISFMSIIGIILIIRISATARVVLFPLAMALLIVASVLQQSMSVHLLGYSYIFSFLFVSGLVGIVIQSHRHIQINALTLIVATPIALAVSLMSIRINMLSGLSH